MFSARRRYRLKRATDAQKIKIQKLLDNTFAKAASRTTLIGFFDRDAVDAVPKE